MTNLRCGVKSCTNNYNYKCCLPRIDVTGKTACDCGGTCCSSFGEKGMYGKNAMSAYEAEAATEIGCDVVNCVYNDHNVCSANTVGIAGRKAVKCYDTDCDTFRMRK